MELFYSRTVSEGGFSLDAEESNHCVRVLRHRRGDEISVIDGVSNLYRCRIVDDNPKELTFEVLERVEGYGTHPYHLHIAVAPPKNIDRFEWFCEKSTEIGVDRITPLIGEYSERKVFNGSRSGRILISAAKQSHKSAIPELEEAYRVSDFLTRDFGGSLKLICYCDDVTALGVNKEDISKVLVEGGKEIVVMIGPEGDFSRNEISLAVQNGWRVISLGQSRLRIETAALVATSAVYLIHG